MKYLFLSIFLFCHLISLAQSSLIDGLYKMQKAPILKEKVYVHTNKAAYFSDDVIWFKAYVGDSINRPSAETRILEVELFDNKGTQIFDRKIAISEGTGNGQFELNDAVPPGNYFLRARTNYMRNFGEQYQYLQEITILGENPFIGQQEDEVKYDIQLLPEGGHLIEAIQNTLGIKALINGHSIDFEGIIINKKGDTVTTFNSEHNGMGKCSLFYEKGETYRAKIKFQDTLIERDIPKALTKGVSLQIDNSGEDYLKVYLKTNEGTFYDQIYSNYSLLFHQDRQLFQLVSVSRLDSITGLIETNKNIFLDGVVTATLFADDKPVAERKFFIETDRKKSFTSLEKTVIDNDSVIYKLAARERNKNLIAVLSVSVLHEQSEAADLKNTIKSAFLLRPYVRGTIENPGYYFNTENKKRKEHVDLLLLTQGWAGYTLKEIIEKISPVEKYTFETGFQLRGKIEDETKRKNVVLIPENFRIVDKVPLEGKSEFTFQNLWVFKGDTVRVAYQNWLGKIIKPTSITYDTIIKKTVQQLALPSRAILTKVEMKTTTTFDKIKSDGIKTENNNSISPNVEDGTIALDEVIVSERIRSERYLERRKVIEKYRPLVQNIGKYYDLPISELATTYNISLMDFFRQQGFRLETSDNFQHHLKAPGTLAYLSVNGIFVEPEELLSIVELPMKDIANIMINNTGKRLGPGVRLSFFQVFTANTRQKLFDEFVITEGFDRPIKYYTPMYSPIQPRQLKLKEVDWKPSLRTNKKGEVYFKISKTHEVDKKLFLIQGFSNQGHLISTTIQLE